MDSLKHAFTKSRTSSTSSRPLSSPLKPYDSIATTDTSSKPAKSRGDSMSSNRDSGIARSVLSSLGSPSGRNHSRNLSGSSSRDFDHPNGSLNVSDKLEAVLAKTDEMDAANVAHLAQTISEMRGKSHGLHGIHPGMLTNEFTPASGSSPTRPRSQPDTINFSAATLARTRKTKQYFETRMTAMRLIQSRGESWNLIQCLRDREVRRQSGEQLDLRIFQANGRARGSSTAGSLSSFGGNDSLVDGVTKDGKQHSSPIQTPQRGHLRQQSSKRHADRFRSSLRGVEYWTIKPEELLADIGWQQVNPHKMVDRWNKPIHPAPHASDDDRTDGIGSGTSSFEYDRKGHRRYSSDGGVLSPQSSVGISLSKSNSLRIPTVPSFAMSSASLARSRSRSPSPVRGTPPSKPSHTRQTSDFLDVPRQVRKRIQDKIKGDKTSVSSSHSPTRSVAPSLNSNTENDPFKLNDTTQLARASTLPPNLRLDMELLKKRRSTIASRRTPMSARPSDGRRELAQTRARLISVGTRARHYVSNDNNRITPIDKCHRLMGKLSGLNRSLNSSLQRDYVQASTELESSLSALESQQSQLSEQVHSALTITRTQVAVQIADIAAEQTSRLLLQVKAVEDKMDALEYRTNSGWTHEKTLHLVFLVLEYIVMVVLWHLWLLLSVLRIAKQAVGFVWTAMWFVVVGVVRVIRWLFFLQP